MPVMFLALEPQQALVALVAGFKRQVRAAVGPQQFLDDPPHLTFYLAAFPDAEEVLAAARKLAGPLESVDVELTGWHVFEADPLTGRQTLVCDLAERTVRRLRAMQAGILRALAPLRDAAATEARFAPRFSSLSAERRRAVQSLGFPYVGPDWRPHFTVASIEPGDWPRVAELLLPHPPSGRFECGELTVYRLVEERPEIYGYLALSGIGVAP